MATRLRKALAVLGGALLANATIFGLEQASQLVYPVPVGLDFHDAQAVRTYIGSLPVSAWVLLLASYAVGSFAGGAVATATGGRSRMWPAAVVGAIVTAGGAWNVLEIPHPMWFVAASLVTYLPFAWLGGRAAIRRRDAQPAGAA